MADKGTGTLIQKLEETKIQMLKNKNKILKRFGKPGLKVYKEIVRGGISLEELSKKSGFPEGELIEIIKFMEQAGIVEVSGEIPEKPQPEPRKPAGFEIEPVGEEEGEEEEAEEKKEEVEEKKEAPFPLEIPQPPAPALPAAPPRPPAQKEEKPQPEPRKPEAKPPSGITPIEFEETPSPPPRAPPREPPKEEPEEEFLTPSEKVIKERYGEIGLLVYNYIDGQRTAEQIMRDAGVTEAQLIEMLDFMEKKGIIRLEHPAKRRAPPPSMLPPAMDFLRPPAAQMPPPMVGMRPPAALPPRLGAPTLSKPPQVKSMFAPLIEEQDAAAGPLSEKELAAISLDVPSKATKGNIFLEVQAKAQIMLKFGKEYSRAYEMMDGTKDVVEICVALKIPLYKLYEMLMLLEGMKAVTLKPALREDIRKRYGEDGYSVYKKYGREGVMLYQLIGKEMSLKEIAALTTTDPNKIVEMFMFVHKLLGIELPIDEDLLRERLGIQKKPAEPSQ